MSLYINFALFRGEGVKDIDKESINKEIASLGAKASILEDRYNVLRRKLSLIENNLVELQRDYKQDFRLIEENILELKRMISEMQEKLLSIAQDLNNAATIEDYQEVKAYLSIVNPFKWELKEVNK